jgi:hypothetical protein
MMPFSTSGRLSGPESVQSRFLFDKRSGEIVYVHHVVTMPGAAPTTERGVDERIRELAAEVGIASDDVDVVAVDMNDLDPAGQYRVDPATRTDVRTGTLAGPIPPRP